MNKTFKKNFKKIIQLSIITIYAFSPNVSFSNEFQEEYTISQNNLKLQTLSDADLLSLYDKSLNLLYCTTDDFVDLENFIFENKENLQEKSSKFISTKEKNKFFVEHTNKINNCFSIELINYDYLINNNKDKEENIKNCWLQQYKKYNSFFNYFKNELIEVNSVKESIENQEDKKNLINAIKTNYSFLEYTKDFLLDYNKCFKVIN